MHTESLCHCCLPLQAVIELQRRCPNARLMYVSATGATEAENLGYMERLGLWGKGTPYTSKKDFTGMLKKGGMGEWRHVVGGFIGLAGYQRQGLRGCLLVTR